MPKALNIIGDIYGRWTVLKEVPTTKAYAARRYLCKCSCGTIEKVWQVSLRKGTSKSCGCLQVELATTHGGRYSPLYNHWKGMKGRCYIPSAGGYINYGGKGITIYESWKNDFAVFRSWAEANGYKPGLTIDRKDGDKNYTPDNCRWVTMSIQARNKKKKRGTTSQYIGVSWQPSRNKWIATAQAINGKRINLGRYTDEIDAAKARDKYITDNNLEGYILNFP